MRASTARLPSTRAATYGRCQFPAIGTTSPRKVQFFFCHALRNGTAGHEDRLGANAAPRAAFRRQGINLLCRLGDKNTRKAWPKARADRLPTRAVAQQLTRAER